MENALNRFISKMRTEQFLGYYNPLIVGGLISLEKAIEILQEAEIAIRNECECEDLKKEHY